MRKVLMTLFCVSLLTAFSAVAISQSENEQVTICHIPPGNPSAAHTITVGAPAVEAHLNHGDSIGSCEELGPNYVSITVFTLLLAGWAAVMLYRRTKVLQS